MAASISAAQGMLGWAPDLVQQREPATTPRRRATSKLWPWSSAAAKAPVKLSPAAVVSTALIVGAAAAKR